MNKFLHYFHHEEISYTTQEVAASNLGFIFYRHQALCGTYLKWTVTCYEENMDNTILVNSAKIIQTWVIFGKITTNNKRLTFS